MSFMAYLCIGTFFAACSAPVGSACAIFGVVGRLLWPIGLFEIIGGVLFFSDPRKYAELSRTVAMVEVASLLLGGVFSAGVGVAVLLTHGEEDVIEYLESEPNEPERIAANEAVSEPKTIAEKVAAVASDENDEQ
jgi:hypothetical protein